MSVQQCRQVGIVYRPRGFKGNEEEATYESMPPTWSTASKVPSSCMKYMEGVQYADMSSLAAQEVQSPPRSSLKPADSEKPGS